MAISCLWFRSALLFPHLGVFLFLFLTGTSLVSRGFFPSHCCFSNVWWIVFGVFVFGWMNKWMIIFFPELGFWWSFLGFLHFVEMIWFWKVLCDGRENRGKRDVFYDSDYHDHSFTGFIWSVSELGFGHWWRILRCRIIWCWLMILFRFILLFVCIFLAFMHWLDGVCDTNVLHC